MVIVDIACTYVDAALGSRLSVLQCWQVRYYVFIWLRIQLETPCNNYPRITDAYNDVPSVVTSYSR